MTTSLRKDDQVTNPGVAKNRKNTLTRVPTSAHDPEHKAEVSLEAKPAPEPRNRHERRKAAALARGRGRSVANIV